MSVNIVLRNLSVKPEIPKPNLKNNIPNSPFNDVIEEEESELEEMFVEGPSLGKVEWGGPTRGGSRLEPTRYGDWDRKGRCSDF